MKNLVLFAHAFGPVRLMNFASKVSDLLSWFPHIKVTVIYIKSDNSTAA